MDKIFRELEMMRDGTDQKSLNKFIEILASDQFKTVCGLGAGRMGYSLQSFIMRLSHLGFSSYMLGDTTLPRVNSDTLAIVNSSSGETPSIKLYVEQCKKAGVYVVAVTTNENSSIADIADLVVYIPPIKSNQLMKTIYEQYSFLLFDYIAGELLDRLKLDISWVEQNHSILE